MRTCLALVLLSLAACAVDQAAIEPTTEGPSQGSSAADTTPAARAFRPEHVWPLSGTRTPDALSSTFGPRQLASEGMRYDFHRGIDLPAAFGSPVFATADGEVRIAGANPNYTGLLVQIQHARPDAGERCEDRGCYYSNYMHLSSVAVAPGQVVRAGDVIGRSGAGESGFAHLHFELRDGGLYQADCVHPLAALPYADDTDATLIVTRMDVADPARPVVTAEVTLPSREADLDTVELSAYDTSSGAPVLMSRASYSMSAWNKLYGDLDDPTARGVEVEPDAFNAGSSVYRIRVTFFELAGPAAPAALRLEARAIDSRGHDVVATAP